MTDLQTLIDRAAIHDLHVRYFHCVDLADEAGFRGCFAEDVVGHYHGRASVKGIDALVASVPIWTKRASGEWKMSTHFMGNLQYRRIEDDVAETEVNAFAFLVLTQRPPDFVAMRSLRYIDRLARIGGQWRIQERLHTLDWACEVPATAATPFAQRIDAIPAQMRDAAPDGRGGH